MFRLYLIWTLTLIGVVIVCVVILSRSKNINLKDVREFDKSKSNINREFQVGVVSKYAFSDEEKYLLIGTIMQISSNTITVQDKYRTSYRFITDMQTEYFTRRTRFDGKVLQEREQFPYPLHVGGTYLFEWKTSTQNSEIYRKVWRISRIL